MPYGYQPCSRLLLVSILAGIFLLSSCDAVTDPDIASPEGQPFSGEAASTTAAGTEDTESFNCYISQLTADGTYVEKLAKIPIPTSLGWSDYDELAIFSFRNIFPGTTIITRVANCFVPDNSDVINYLADILEADSIEPLGVHTHGDDCDDPDVAFCGDLDEVVVTASRCDNETSLSCGGNPPPEPINWEWDEIFDDWNDDNPHEWEPTGDDPDEPCEDCLPPEPCDTDDPIIDDEDVQEAFHELWEASNPDAESLSDRREVGGWIVQEGTDFRIEAWDEDEDNWEFGPCSFTSGSPIHRDDLPTGTVGMVHTHPWSDGTDVSDVCPVAHGADGTYESGPSEWDTEFASTLRDLLAFESKSFIIDADKITPYDSTSDPGPNEDAVERCGY